MDDTFEEEVEEICEDVPGLIRVIASPCRARKLLHSSIIWRGQRVGKGTNDGTIFD